MSFPIHRPRRLRIDGRLRQMVQQYVLRPEQLIYPIFVVEGLIEPKEISAMPGQYHWPVDRIAEPVKAAMHDGIRAFIIFGVPEKKSADGKSATGQDSVVAKALKVIRKSCPEAYLITDVCLCAYTDHGHCGFVGEDGCTVDNDRSLNQLAEMALTHAIAGA
ncbi:MAG: porphobilinogen synthase, partial [Candidatus Rifleibacteriota bacterium]